MRFATIFICIVLVIPVIAVLLYTAVYPRESSLWGMRWRFKNEDLEPSDEAIKYNRVAAIIALVIVVIILVVTIIRT